MKHNKQAWTIAVLFLLTLAGSILLGGWQINNGGGGSGSGTVSANSGSAGAIAFYSAAGGSTTVGPDTNLTDASSTLTYNGIDITTGSLSSACNIWSNGYKLNAGSGANTGITAIAANEVDMCASGSRVATVFSTAFAIDGTANIGFNGGKGQHWVMQAANGDMGGTCTLSSGTCTVTFTTAYTSAPSCVATPTTTGTFTTGATLKVNPGTSSVVITSTTGTDSAVIDYHCFGNPN